MKQVFQPAGSNQCGQTVVANILGVSIAQVCEWMHKRGKTRAVDLAVVLAARGIKVAPRLQRFRGVPKGEYVLERPVAGVPANAVFKFVNQRKRNESHWILRLQNRWLDPEQFSTALWDGRPTSYLEFEPRSSKPRP